MNSSTTHEPSPAVVPDVKPVAPAPPVGLPGGMLDSRTVLSLQANAGNQAVARLIARAPAAAPAAAPGSDQQAGAELKARATAASASFHASSSGLSDAVKDAVKATDSARDLMLVGCAKYDVAYGNVRDVLKDAKESLELQDKVVDTIIGIAIGVAVGTGVGALAEGFAVTATAAKLAWEAAGEGMEAAVAWGVGKTVTEDARESGAQALSAPAGETPTAKKLSAWQQLAGAYRGAAEASSHGEVSNDARHWADLVAGEASVYAGGGKGERSVEEIQRAVIALEKMAAGQQQVPAAVAKLKAATEKVRAAGAAQAKPSETQMEQRIWIEWMADLPRAAAHRVLDNHYVEDHLRAIGVISGDGKTGLLGVDFGNWTTEDDTDEAVTEANHERVDTYRDAFGPQQIGQTGTISSVSSGGGTQPGYWLKIPGTRWDWSVRITHANADVQTPAPLATGVAVRVTGYDPSSKTLSGVPLG